MGIDSSDLFLDHIDKHPSKEYVQIELLLIFLDLLPIFNIFLQRFKQPHWLVHIQIIQQLKRLHTYLLTPQKCNNLVIKMLTNVAHYVLASLVGNLDYA